MNTGKKLKIAFVMTNFPIPGALSIYDRLIGLIDLGHEVNIFALAPARKKFKVHEDILKYDLLNRVSYHGRPSGFKALKIIASDLFLSPSAFVGRFLKSLNISIFGRHSLNLSAYFVLKAFSKHPYFDIIYNISGPTAANVLFLKDLYPQAKFTATFIGFDYSSRIRKTGSTGIYEELFRKADLIFSLSHYSRDCIISLGCPSDKVLKHPVGAEISKFAYKDRIVNKAETMQFITVGRLVEKKGHRLILTAVINLLRKGKALSYHIVGDGPFLDEVRKQVDRDELLKKNVTFHGYKTEMQVVEMLHACHVFVHPSITTMCHAEQEDTPTILLQAQATGMPVISTYHAGIPEVVLNQQTGLLVPERSIFELEKAMEYFIDNPAVCSSMGRKGRELVEKNYEIKMLNKRLSEIFRKLITLKTNDTLGLESTDEINL